MIPALFDAIDETHIQALVDSARAEDRYIDFKVDWGEPPWEGLAADVCAFANTDGGDIVIGMAEVDREASRVLGVECDGVDRKIRQIEQAIRAKIEPLAWFQIRYIPRATGPGVFLIRVVASATAPHRVTNKGIFYSRGSAGNREMDIFQVREAFLRGTLAEEKIREFRGQRIETLARTENTFPGSQYIWALFHVISVPAVMRSRLLPGEALFEHSELLPIFGEAQSDNAPRRFNLDGVVKGRGRNIVQLFRDGKMESRRWLGEFHPTSSPIEPLPLRIVRDGVRTCLTDYVRCLDALEFPPPYSASLTMANTANVPFFGEGRMILKADRRVLQIPEVVVSDMQGASVRNATDQLTDMLYQAFGCSGRGG